MSTPETKREVDPKDQNKNIPANVPGSDGAKAPTWQETVNGFLKNAAAKTAPILDQLRERSAGGLEVIKSFSGSITQSWPKLSEKFPSLYNVSKHIRTRPYSRVLVLISSMSLSYKIATTLITVLALAIASLGAVTFSRQKKLLQQEMRKRAEVLIQQLANVGKEGLLTKHDLPAFTTIKDFQSNLGAVYGLVVDGNGKVFAHSSPDEKGKVLEGPADKIALGSTGLMFHEVIIDGEPVLEAVMPITLKARDLKIGTARIGLSQKELLENIRHQKWLFFWISILFVTIGLLISFGLAKVLTRPIYTLSVGMQEVAHGDLSQLVKVFYKDEIGKLTEVFNEMIISLREKLHMEKYLSNSVMKSIKKNRDAGQLRLGGESRYVTALFSDVRGFTSMSEKMTPEEVVGLLNIYLNLQGKVVLQRDGVVDKFVGDEVMAIFEGHGTEINAVRAAIEIQNYVKALNWARARAGQKQMQIGIGLNSGTVIMGNMGSEEQMNYTVIGDNINVAARLCSAAQPGQVIVSKPIADAIGKQAKLKKLEPVMVKGKEKPLEIFEVVDVGGASRKYMRRAITLPATYRFAGLEEANQTALKNIASAGCLMELTTPVGVGTRITIDIDLKGQTFNQLPAIVKHVRKHDGLYHAGVQFEEITDVQKSQLLEWVHRTESEIVNGPAVS